MSPVEVGGATLADPEAMLVGLGVATLVILGTLRFLGATVDRGTVIAFFPWIVAGAATYVLYSVGAYPGWVAPAFGAGGVALTTFTFAGMVWSLAVMGSSVDPETARDDQYVLAAGLGAALVTLAAVFARGIGASSETVLYTFGGMFGAVVLAFLVYVLLGLIYSQAVVQTGLLGWLVVFGHALDAVTTAVAVDVVGRPADYALAGDVVEYAGTLPTAGSIGTGWLWVLVQVGLAAIVVSLAAALLSGRLEDRPGPVDVVLGAVLALGLAPGVHRMLVFLVG